MLASCCGLTFIALTNTHVLFWRAEQPVSWGPRAPANGIRQTRRTGDVSRVCMSNEPACATSEKIAKPLKHFLFLTWIVNDIGSSA